MEGPDARTEAVELAVGARRSAVPRPVVVFAGEAGSFAEDAALDYFDEPATIRVAGFRDVFRAVESNDPDRRAADGVRVDAGVVPIENVVGGTIREVYDLLLEHRLEITGEVITPVRLCLAVVPGERIEGIERVYSHIQALGQAEAFLRSRPWSLLASTNTAGAGKMISDHGERGAAAVLSPRAAALHGLEVLASDIQTSPDNRTRFLVLGRPERHGTSSGDGSAAPMRSTVVLAVPNVPGSLHRVLGILARHGWNMSKLESRPRRDRAWEYVFWVDLDGDLSRPDARPMLDELRAETAMLRVMGAYRRAPEPS